jgi:hypothetical protein
MPRVGFAPIIPVFERAKGVHALDRAVTVIGLNFLLACEYQKQIDKRILKCLNSDVFVCVTN